MAPVEGVVMEPARRETDETAGYVVRFHRPDEPLSAAAGSSRSSHARRRPGGHRSGSAPQLMAVNLSDSALDDIDRQHATTPRILVRERS